jgi:hypothetical protein
MEREEQKGEKRERERRKIDRERERRCKKGSQRDLEK